VAGPSADALRRLKEELLSESSVAALRHLSKKLQEDMAQMAGTRVERLEQKFDDKMDGVELRELERKVEKILGESRTHRREIIDHPGEGAEKDATGARGGHLNVQPLWDEWYRENERDITDLMRIIEEGDPDDDPKAEAREKARLLDKLTMRAVEKRIFVKGSGTSEEESVDGDLQKTIKKFRAAKLRVSGLLERILPGEGGLERGSGGEFADQPPLHTVGAYVTFETEKLMQRMLKEGNNRSRLHFRHKSEGGGEKIFPLTVAEALEPSATSFENIEFPAGWGASVRIHLSGILLALAILLQIVAAVYSTSRQHRSPLYVDCDLMAAGEGDLRCDETFGNAWAADIDAFGLGAPEFASASEYHATKGRSPTWRPVGTWSALEDASFMYLLKEETIQKPRLCEHLVSGGTFNQPVRLEEVWRQAQCGEKH